MALVITRPVGRGVLSVLENGQVIHFLITKIRSRNEVRIAIDAPKAVRILRDDSFFKEKSLNK
jgi:sRNA-binding carbon storage regulator CsrA